MKISPLDVQARISAGIAQTADKSGANEDLFSKILKTAAENQSGKDNINSVIPLDKEKIKTLLQVLRLQMNQRLLNSVMMEDDDQSGSDPGFLKQQALPLSPGLFNKPQLPSKNEPERGTPVAVATDNPVKIAPAGATGRFDAIIERAAETHNVDPGLIKAVIRTESGFNTNAISPKGARGLMQLMPGTARDLGVKNPHNPEENIMAGTRYLKGLLDRYDGNQDLALAAYNWGMGNVERNPGRLPRETINYVARVNQNYQG